MSEHEEVSLEKWNPSIATKEELYDALEKAFDYRGDITITLKNGEKIVGYIFNRETKASEPFVQLFPADRDEKLNVYYKDVASLNFSGVDTAAGKSWRAWMEKYKAKEAAEAAALAAGAGKAPEPKADSHH